MAVTNGTSRVKRTPEEKKFVRLTIPQDKSRAQRWAEQRKERNTLAILPNQDYMITVVDVSLHKPEANNEVLQHLLVKRLTLL